MYVCVPVEGSVNEGRKKCQIHSARGILTCVGVLCYFWLNIPLMIYTGIYTELDDPILLSVEVNQ